MIRNNIFKVILILFIFSVFTISNGQTVNIKIIETTDVHGVIFPYNFKYSKKRNHSLAQVSSYVKEQRAETDQNVLLLDNGDILQGTPLVYYYNFMKPDEKNIYAQVMNYMKYDAGTVGNHDIETGHDVYDKFRDELNFPWLAANAVKDNGEPYFQPYEIFNVKGVKVAVLGMVTPYIPHWLPKQIWSGMHFEDMIESAEKWVKIIEEKENPDLMIGLFHSGLNYNYGNQTKDTYKNENASRLVAEQVSGFDIIFAGHDHSNWNEKVTAPNGKKVVLLGATSQARYVSTASIECNFDKTEENWESFIDGNIVDVSKLQADEELINKFQFAADETKEFVSQKIGFLHEDLSAKNAMFGPSKFIDFINSVQLDLTNADVSFTAPLSFNSKLNKGNIYIKDMFNLYKYENLLYTMKLSGKEIKNYLEYSYSKWYSTVDDNNDYLLKYELDQNDKPKYSDRYQSYQLKHRYYNFDCAAGINYEVDITKEPGNRITINSLSDGSEFDFEKYYTVALNSYRGNGGGGHLIDGAKIDKENLEDRILNSTEKDLRFYFIEWIKKHKDVYPKSLNNWKVVPNGLWKELKEKEMKMLYN